MKARRLHPWDIPYQKAVKLQEELRTQLVFGNLPKKIRRVAGADVSCSKRSKRVWAGVVVLSYPQLEKVEERWAKGVVDFPYIPGLLSFREIPLVLDAIELLESEPDLFFCDGQGIAHPRGLGLASHLGLLIRKPTIGCAKSRLTGSYQEPDSEKGAYSPLKDEKADNDETIGAVVRTRTNVKPVFVSVGHKCLLDDAIRITLMCAVKYRLPEPTRFAHQQVSQLRLKM